MLKGFLETGNASKSNLLDQKNFFSSYLNCHVHATAKEEYMNLNLPPKLVILFTELTFIVTQLIIHLPLQSCGVILNWWKAIHTFSLRTLLERIQPAQAVSRCFSNNCNRASAKLSNSVSLMSSDNSCRKSVFSHLPAI